MADYQSRLLQELTWRGMLHDATPGADALLTQPQRIYVGFDPTADSLHIGNLASLMLLVHAQRAGHTPIALVGGATGMIGDPSGKRAERSLLDLDTLRHNQAAIRAQLEGLLQFEGVPNPAQVVNNYDWYAGMGVLDFLRDIGKHLTINYMLSKDSMQNRLETGLSFTEFSYQLLQGYDFLHLYRNQGVRVQMGGSDQWGNITAGTELIRRMTFADTGEEVTESLAHGIVTPLITKADGTKFGKSEQGNIWLDARKTSPYRLYQFLLNTADADVARLLKVFSLQDQVAIETLLTQQAENPGARAAQIALAEELTIRLHGEAALTQAKQASGVLFGGESVQLLETMTEAQLADLFEGVPRYQLSRTALDAGLGVIAAVAHPDASLGFPLPSNAEARKLIQGGGLRINKEKVADDKATITATQLIAGKYLLVQKGKKQFYLAEAV